MQTSNISTLLLLLFIYCVLAKTNKKGKGRPRALISLYHYSGPQFKAEVLKKKEKKGRIRFVLGRYSECLFMSICP